MALSRRQRAKAEQRAAKGYPAAMHGWGTVVEAHGSEWMSQFDAAAVLGVPIFRIGVLISNRHLVPAESERGEAGVTRDSVDRERAWRSSASLLRRSVRILRDMINWL